MKVGPKTGFASQFRERLQPTSFANVLYVDACWLGLACKLLHTEFGTCFIWEHAGVR